VTHLPTGGVVELDGFITNFSDTVTANVQSEDMYGRMDPLQKYSNTRREISLDMDLVAECDQDGLTNSLKIRQLQSFLYPAYDGTTKSTLNNNKISSIYSPPLCRIDWNVHLQECYGYLKPISITWTKEDSIFFYSNDKRALIFGIHRIKLGMTVLHDYKVGFSAQDEFSGPQNADSLGYIGFGSRVFNDESGKKNAENKKQNEAMDKKAMGMK
jgi:hypothetical protein